MRRWSLRTKILLTASGILLALIGATLAYVSVQANAFVTQRIAADLEDSSRILAESEADRFRTLELTAEVLTSVSVLIAAIGTADPTTIRESLADYVQSTGRADLLIALSPSGQTLGRTDAIAPTEVPGARTAWTEPLLAGRQAHGFLSTPSGIYQAAAQPVGAGGSLFGFLLVGSRLDATLAQRLRAATSEEIVVFSEEGILGSTLPVAPPWRSGAEWAASATAKDAQPVVTIAGERYAVRALPGADASITYLILQSRDRALAPYRRIQLGLLLLGVLAFAVGVGASAVLARSVTAPVARLVEGTKQIAAGNFDFALDVQSGDELGALATSFNTMTTGLRERADMQKFVSQSTMEMIQSPARHSAGERKHLTILFSDVRGFSRFAEQRPPEDAVEWLNKCLGAQADLVRKHNGDVDKFIGDAVFAVFDGEDMAFDAVRCAVEIQRYMERLEAPTDEPLEVGIGIVTGDVIVGSIGSADRLDHTAVGNQVNLCSRLCSMAGPREILIADSTYGLVRDLVSAEPLEAVAVRGLAQPVDVHRMVIARLASTPATRSTPPVS
jgi:class 3 adenylate cyclase